MKKKRIGHKKKNGLTQRKLELERLRRNNRRRRKKG